MNEKEFSEKIFCNIPFHLYIFAIIPVDCWGTGGACLLITCLFPFSRVESSNRLALRIKSSGDPSANVWRWLSVKYSRFAENPASAAESHPFPAAAVASQKNLFPLFFLRFSLPWK